MGRGVDVPVESASEGPESDGPDRANGVELSSMEPSPSSLYYRSYVRMLLGRQSSRRTEEGRRWGNARNFQSIDNLL